MPPCPPPLLPDPAVCATVGLPRRRQIPTPATSKIRSHNHHFDFRLGWSSWRSGGMGGLGTSGGGIELRCPTDPFLRRIRLWNSWSCGCYFANSECIESTESPRVSPSLDYRTE